ncbi:MAG: hypothetical protein GY854_19805 [Deltaproteobacteria bacterium]|nr:hypothetical protein [Deltaproteobacteria bacterium]
MPETLLDLEAEHHADLDIRAESQEDAVAKRVLELYQDPDERDEGVWSFFEADLELVIEDFEETPINERNAEYRDLFESMVIATRMQVWHEFNGSDFLPMVEEAGQRIAAQVKKMSSADIKAAAAKGIGKGRISAAKEKKLANG